MTGASHSQCQGRLAHLTRRNGNAELFFFNGSVGSVDFSLSPCFQELSRSLGSGGVRRRRPPLRGKILLLSCWADLLHGANPGQTS